MRISVFKRTVFQNFLFCISIVFFFQRMIWSSFSDLQCFFCWISVFTSFFIVSCDDSVRDGADVLFYSGTDGWHFYDSNKIDSFQLKNTMKKNIDFISESNVRTKASVQNKSVNNRNEINGDSLANRNIQPKDGMSNLTRHILSSIVLLVLLVAIAVFVPKFMKPGHTEKSSDSTLIGDNLITNEQGYRNIFNVV